MCCLLNLVGVVGICVEMSSLWWVPLFVLLLGDLRLAGADKSVQPEDATLPVWSKSRTCFCTDPSRVRRLLTLSMSSLRGPQRLAGRQLKMFQVLCKSAEHIAALRRPLPHLC